MSIVKFSEVAHRAYTREDRFNTEKIYYVGGEHIDSCELYVTKKGVIKGSTIGPMFYCGFTAGQILFVTRNPHLKKCSIADFDGICSEKTFVIETKDESILTQEYLAIIMQSDDFWNYCEENKSGGVNYFLNWSTLADYEFELPPIKQQLEIAQKVMSAYRLKQSYKKLLDATREMVKSQFIEMFKDDFPKLSWEECLTIINGKKYDDDYQESGTYPICGSGGIMGYGERMLCPKDTVILGRKGNINSPIYMETDYWIVDTAFCLDVDRTKLHPKYFYFWCKLFDFTRYNKQGVLPSLTKNDLLKIEMPIPPMELQTKFVAIIEQSDKSEFELRKSIDAIDQVIKSLINNIK